MKTQVERITATPGAVAQTIEPPPSASTAPTAKTSLCYVNTPEYLRTFRGRFLYIYQGNGHLRLDDRTLSFASGWHSVTIPLTSIRSLARGEYPFAGKPIPLHYIEVAFEDHGTARTLLFTPTRSAVLPVWETNKVVAEWLTAIHGAAEKACGRALPLSRVAMPGRGWGEVLKAFALMALLCSLALLVIPIIAEHRLPNRWTDYLPGPLVAGLTLGLGLALRAFMERRALTDQNLNHLTHQPWASPEEAIGPHGTQRMPEAPAEAGNAPAMPASPHTVVPGFDPANDFILCPPQLPRMARAITVYALTIAPLLWLLSLFTIEPLPDHPLVGFVQAMVNLAIYGLEFLLTILLAIGGWKLRGLHHSAVSWLRTVIWLRIGCGLLAIVGVIWVETLASQFLPDAPTPRPHLSDGLMAAFGLAAVVFEISALVWLRRHRAGLRALCTKGQKPLYGSPSYWQQTWLSWPAGGRFGVKVGIVVVVLVLGCLFGYYRIEWVHDGPYVVRNSVVGWPTPWVSFWRSPWQNSELDWGFELFTFSFAAGLGALALVILFARLRAIERRWGEAVRQQPVTAAPRSEATGPAWSRASIAGAALVGLSLPLPVLVGVLVMFRMVRIGLAEVLLALGATALFGVPGTILGWVGLSDLRTRAGQLRGLPFAVFAALAWPLALLLSVTGVVPMLVAIPVAAGEGPPLWTRFTVLVPAGVITFAIWAVYATSRWGANRPASARRGVLKWIFLALVLALGGFGLANLPHRAQSARPEVATLRPYPNQVQPQPGNAFNGFIEVPAGHLLRLEARLWSNGIAVPAGNLTAHILAPRDRPHRDLLAWRILSVGEPGNRGAGWNVTIGGGRNPVLYPPTQGAERPDWHLAGFHGVVAIPADVSRSVPILRGSGLAADGSSAAWEVRLDLRLTRPPSGGFHNEDSLVGSGFEPDVRGTVLHPETPKTIPVPSKTASPEH